ncbi:MULTISPECIES: hypothetical protein [Streptomyces]|uniref:hypothetical protein n=1 Tax=Streptomyces TaxID=1883 RepID=UPI0019D07708|nr:MULTISPECIES: hypothetical protein [Streptomyces]WRY80207.1 hypothetical protein OG388_02765 [Streptomyces clavifer]
MGRAGARRVTSGSTEKQLAGLVTAPLRRPGLHVHGAAPLDPADGRAFQTAGHERPRPPDGPGRTTVTTVWRTTASRPDEASALSA